HAVVVPRVVGGEGHRQGVAAGAQDGAGSRGVGEGAEHVGRSVQLGAAQGRAVDDGRRVGPGDGRRRRVHGERHAGGGRGVVGRVRGGEGHREGVAAGFEGPRDWIEADLVQEGVVEGAGHVGRRVKKRAYGHPGFPFARVDDDVRRVGPGERRRGLQDGEGHGLGHAAVVGYVGGDEGHRQGVAGGPPGGAGGGRGGGR